MTEMTEVNKDKLMSDLRVVIADAEEILRITADQAGESAADLRSRLGLTYLMVSHDLSMVRYISDRVAVMYLGRIVEIAPKRAIFTRPLHPYTEALLESVPVPDPLARRARRVLTGDVPSPINPPSGCHFHTRCPYVEERCKRETPLMRQVAPEQFVACHLRAPMAQAPNTENPA